MRSVLIFIAVLITANSIAQPQGYKQHINVQELQKSLADANKELSDISSDFKQIKNLSLLEEKLHSKGRFYYKKEFKVRIEYTEPFSYLMVMNGGKMLVKDEQKSNTINTGNSKMMQSVNRIIVDCMSGNVFANPDFKVNAYTGAKKYLISMRPVSAEMKKMFDKIDVYLEMNDLKVISLVMTEKGGDYTSMDFYNIQHNSSLNESLFKVK